jgi:orotate phosphoribosyltransferase
MTLESSPKKIVQAETDPIRLLEDSGALLFGEFILSSGKTSDYYFDSKKLTMEPYGARFVARNLVDRLDAEGIRYVGGVAYGAIPIVSHVVMLTGLRDDKPIRAFYHRKDSKEHGTGATAEGQFPPGGEPVAIIEDVVTTGSSLMTSIRDAEGKGFNVTHALSLIDRDEGGREVIEAAGYKFWALFTVERSGDEVTFVYNGS